MLPTIRMPTLREQRRVSNALHRHHQLVSLRYLGAIVRDDDDEPPPAAGALAIPVIGDVEVRAA
jgi:hypothetical protein